MQPTSLSTALLGGPRPTTSPMARQRRTRGSPSLWWGASHAGRLAATLEEGGHHVINFSTPGWRLSEEAVEQLARQVTEAVTQLGNCVLIYQIFDNNVHFSCTGPGERALPRKAQDGYYHIEGKLKMADRA